MISDPRSSDLLNEVLDEGFEDREHAERAVRATLAALAERLTHDETRMLAAALPHELRNALAARRAAAVEKDVPPHSDLAQLVERMRSHGRHEASTGRAREEIQIVCGALGRRLTDDDRRIIARALPEEIAADLEGPSRDLPEASESSGPSTLRSGMGRTLATGRPGSRHPISEVAADPAHRESIARTRNPHGDSKLSSARGLTQERERETLATGRPGTERSLSDANDRATPSHR